MTIRLTTYRQSPTPTAFCGTEERDLSLGTAEYQGPGTAHIPITNCLQDHFRSSMAEDIREGLSRPQKTLPCKYFYDERGSRLFEEICRLPEYYLTRAEMAILEQRAPELMEGLFDLDLVEIGSGANWKIKILFSAADRLQRKTLRYVPVDVCEEELLVSARDLLNSFPELAIHGVVGDFTCHMDRVPNERQRKFAFFGSTIGNFTAEDSASFLSHVADSMNRGDTFLLGCDMIKSVQIMEKAYNDSRGVTAAFNKNILQVINDELAANFDLNDFRHVAYFNHEEQRIEMHLEAARDMDVVISDLGMAFDFRKGETIHTEICRKFTPATMKQMVEEAGFRIDKWLTDDKRAFSLLRLTAPG